MLSRTRIILACTLFGVFAQIGGCSTDPYNTDAPQQCADSIKNGNETDVDCGGTCPTACAALKICKIDSDCATKTCLSGLCYPATCSNNLRDATETDVDCGGGACPACAKTKLCLQNSDCTAGSLCLEGTCFPATCKNNLLDGTETDKDCGGALCPACTKGKACVQATDCESGVPCSAEKCGDPQCFDLQLDGTETAVDCGGTSCAPCGLARPCLVHSDCESLNCAAGFCAAATCSDGNRNQGESDIDCGDATLLCVRCPKGSTCTDASNCDSKHCVTGICAAAACDDGILNGSETATDCGGSCSPCVDDSPCLLPADCASGVCTSGFCQSPTCFDGIKNGPAVARETGTDCGGPCALPPTSKLCGIGEGCVSNDDCAFKNCNSGICQSPTCANLVKDPTETDVDCGGTCPACIDGSACLSSSDCQSKVCASTATGKACSPAGCKDLVQNGNETDIDCGGVTCTQRCAVGDKCVTDSDCLTKVCDSATNRCLAAGCSDTKQNGNETGPDCGGSCVAVAKTCGTGLGCNVDADCASTNCCTATSCQTALNTCVAPSCSDGKKNQDETGIDCGGNTCSKRCGANQPCTSKADCDSNVCTGNICQPPKCDDGVKNGNEAGIDCGTACPNRCGTGTACSGKGDCLSGVCSKDATGVATCAAPTCSDTVMNGDETCSADHGGTGVGCLRCPEGSACKVKSDCDTVANPKVDCLKNICAVDTCGNGVQAGSETDVDCGGTCGPCPDGKKCLVTSDCISKHCAADGTGLHCAPASCSDGIVNQGESGTDCGGTSPCGKCGTNLGCTVATDCVNGVCDAYTRTCAAPTCFDTVQNQGETATDCGGPNCTGSTYGCGDGLACSIDADCKNLWCRITSGTTGTCQTPICGDGAKNGTETDVDCGGTCTTKCADTKRCAQNSDCTNGWCNGSVCATPSCSDSVANGTETGPDCGGNCASSCPTAYDANCKLCGDGSGCTKNNDCKSLSCSTGGACVAPSGTGAAACVGKVLDGTTCTQCTTTQCKNVLWCIYDNTVSGRFPCDNPGTVNTSGAVYVANCTDGGKNGPCSVNVLKYASTTIEAAIKAFRCACP